MCSHGSTGRGGSNTLSWNVTKATSLSIDQGVGTVTGTSITVTPTTKGKITYTLTAANSYGTSTATTTVTVSSNRAYFLSRIVTTASLLWPTSHRPPALKRTFTVSLPSFRVSPRGTTLSATDLTPAGMVTVPVSSR